ncbi:MAG: thermonuclease family protein [Candidatus Omnitrophica bacterium]|nr:thermonuclease family protein [Candidatus Omnitrophota bacterium]
MNRILIIVILAGLLILPAFFFTACNNSSNGVVYKEGKASIPFGRFYNYADIFVKRAVDGDTLVLESGERVRLIGIDTPEMHESDKLYRDSQRTRQDIRTIQKLGRRAYEFTKSLVEGKRVSLEFDLEKRDKYGRLLSYVYLKDGTFVNAKIVEEGYASLMTFPPNVKYADLFLRLSQEGGYYVTLLDRR